MPVKMLFVIGAPRSGTTMLERILSSHSMILGGPEPHLLTPLAHLGYWEKVDKAPYDHVLAAEAQRSFVDALPNKGQDYWDACRAYCDTLYGRYLSTSNKSICLDKTPAYALVLPFIIRVFPDAKYVVLTRHPLALFSSYANSFFDGDYEAAHNYNPLLNRYVPALAAFLRRTEPPHFHIRYEDLVKDPETWMQRIYSYAGVPFERDTIEYGNNANEGEPRKGLGDPIGVQQHTRPTTDSVKKWVEDLAGDPAKLRLMRRIVSQLDPEDLAALGYPLDTLWKPMEEVHGKIITPRKAAFTRYRIERKLIVVLRRRAQKGGLLRRLLNKARLACDVLLRD
jgi:hypothetical protein